MNIIKGLIIKDILQLKSYKRTLIIFIVIFTLTSISQESNTMDILIIMLTLGFGMFSMASFNYDEFNKADRYILTLPLTKKEVVLSKYILVIFSTILGSIIGVVLGLILSSMFYKQLPDIKELISVGLGGILGIGIVEGIQIPCVYKWGAEKGRIQMFIITALVALLVGGVIYIGENTNIQLSTNNILNILSTFLPIILITLTIIVYYISYKVAYKIYSRKEI